MDVTKCKTVLDVRSQKSEKLQVVTPDPRKDKSLAIFQRQNNHTKEPKNSTQITTEKRPTPTSSDAHQHNRYLHPIRTRSAAYQPILTYIIHGIVQRYTIIIFTYIPYRLVQKHTSAILTYIPYQIAQLHTNAIVTYIPFTNKK